MFRLSFFRPLSAQKRELLAAKEFAPVPLHRAVERQLKLADSAHQQPSLRATRPWHIFWYTLSENRELIREAVLWYALSAIAVLGAVFFARDSIQPSSSIWTGIGLATGYFVLKAIQAGIDYRNANLERQIHRGLQLALFRCVNVKLIRISPAGRAKFTKGQLKTLVGSDVGAIEDFLSAALYQFVPLFVSSLILVPVLALVSGMVGLIGLLVMFFVVPLASVGAWLVEMTQKRSQAEQDLFATAVGEWVKNIRLVRFLGWNDSVEHRLNEVLQRLVKWTGLRGGVIAGVYAVSHSWSVVPLLVIISLSSLQEVPLNLVEVFSSFWLLEPLYGRIQAIPVTLTRFGSAVAGAQRLLTLLEEPDLDTLMEGSSSNLPPFHEVPTGIILKNVSVAFGATTALDSCSLHLRLDHCTAIVGSVGGGKSTLLELLVGELPPTTGEIEIAFPSGCYPLWRPDMYHRWRSEIAYSPQQPFLSNTSLRDNLDISGHHSAEEVDLAIAASQLSDDLALFPRGLAEEIGESGINLSGGQKQRVSLARAFISQRSILVLDDPLSAVDPKTENLLMDAILERGRGVILVSHRLAELERCDRVLVLDGGKVVEDGEPKELAQNPSSRFAEFLRAVEERGDQ